MRWTEPGAQAILDLRAVRINDDWDDYQRFHRQRQHQRLYGAYSAVPPTAVPPTAVPPTPVPPTAAPPPTIDWFRASAYEIEFCQDVIVDWGVSGIITAVWLEGGGEKWGVGDQVDRP